MVASNVISALCIAAAFVTAHPINEQLAARQFGSITSTQSASSSYQSLTNQIRTLRENIAAGRVNVSEARSQFQSFSRQATSTFSAINGCSTCFTSSSASSFSESARQTYSEFDSLIDTSNRVYGQQAPTVLSPFSNLDSHFKQNLNLFSQSGVGLQSIVPPTFTNNLSRVGLSQTANYASHYVGGSSGF